jgi:hypothetical protein
MWFKSTPPDRRMSDTELTRVREELLAAEEGCALWRADFEKANREMHKHYGELLQVREENARLRELVKWAYLEGGKISDIWVDTWKDSDAKKALDALP